MDLFSPYNHQDTGLSDSSTRSCRGNSYENVIRDFTLDYSSEKSRLFGDEIILIRI